MSTLVYLIKIMYIYLIYEKCINIKLIDYYYLL